MLDSLCGVDESGAVVPDPYLPKPVQYGIYARPRQSFFINRFLALKNYLTYANEILAQYPISETRRSLFLFTEGTTNLSTDPVYNTDPTSPYYSVNPWTGPIIPFYSTIDYWTYINWWATGYDDNTKSALQVPVYADLATIDATAGLIVTVTANGDGKTETYVFTNLGTWERIGLQDGTIAFSSNLWDYATARLGFGDNFFDTTPYDTYPSQETRSIVRALNEEIYTNDLLIYRNKSLILLFEFIQSETIESQNYLPWLNKTSFIDVAHTIRELRPIEVFQSDNQDFLFGYVNEVKPYHVVVKEFLFKYTGTDVYTGNITDFDLPAQYNTDIQQFVTPELVYANPSSANQYLPTDPIWQSPAYSEWFNNYGLSITGVNNYQITILASYISLNSSAFAVDNAFGFPINGTVLIGDELIGYSSVDRTSSTLSGLTRGVNGTPISAHIPGEIITIDLPAVLLLNGGRGYTEPPRVTAYIDTTIYPEPRIPAVFQAVMNLDSILRIDVINPGSGYAVLPEIIIDTSISIIFSSAEVSILTNTIILYSPFLQTGDLVKYNVGTDTTPIGGLDPNQYYYVNVLETSPSFVIALYTNYGDAINDSNRVLLYSTGSGVNNILSVSARASCVSTSIPIRENEITLRFDRTSYTSQVTNWQSGEFYGSYYAGTYNNSERISSSSITIAPPEFEYNPPIDSILASAQGATFEIEGVTNNEVLEWSSLTRIVSNINSSNNQLTITAAEGGASLINSDTDPNPTIGFYIGMPVKFSGSVNGNIIVGTTYYIKSLVDGNKFTLSNSISGGVPGSVLSMSGTTLGSAGLTCYVGEVTNTAVVTLFYSGILDTTATAATVNTLTIPLNPSNLGGTYGFYTGLPIFFTGNVFGNVIENETYYITTVINTTTFTMSTSADPITFDITATTSSGNLITCSSTAGLSVNDPIIFTNIVVASGSTNIIAGTTYYISMIDNFNEQIQISNVVNGSAFNPGTSTSTMLAVNQKDTVQLTTATGNMTCNVGLPVSPGQITGQQFSFYPTQAAITGLTGTNGNLITRDIASALASGDYFAITSASGGLTNIYVNMPIRVSTSYGPLSTGTTYYVIDTGTVQTEVTASSPSTGLTCTSTDGFYLNMPIEFTGSSIGGTLLSTEYYVKTIIDGTHFTISETPGGFPFVLTNDSGSMIVTGEPYINLSTTLGGGSVNVVTNVTTSCVMTQYPTAVPEFDVSWILGGYSVSVASSNPGAGYAVNNTITILGTNLTGVTPTNDLVMTVNTIGTNGEITSVISSGTPVENVQQYYLKVISATECEVYSDSLLQIPVSGINFPYTTGDYAFLPEPFYFNQSIVKYNNRVYQCIISNNDTEFIFGKWELLQSDSRKLNALDRIIGYYQPTVNMPGVDLTQLVDGITYPNSTYLGNAFAPADTFTLDTDLQDTPFSPTQVDTTSIVWDGVNYFAPANTPTYSDIINSINGITWLSNKVANQPLALTDILYADSKYVMTSQNQATPIFVSNDGIVWTTTGLVNGTVNIQNTSLNSVAYFNGVYVGVGDVIVSSTNAYNWTQRFSFTGVVLYGVSSVSINNFDGFIAVGTGPDYSVIPTGSLSVILKSLDGITWTNITPSASTETLYGVTSGNNTIIVVGNSGTIFTSINGSNWNDISTGAANLRDVVYSDSLGLFVAVGEAGFIGTYDGSTWTPITPVTTQRLNSVIWNSDVGEFVITGNNNIILKSTDGTTWTSSNIFVTDPTVYDVQGDAFTAGYGPEELVPGVVSDNLTMIITTRPGTNWDADVYAHVGYNVINHQVTPIGAQVTFSFDGFAQTPAQVAVYQINETTNLGTALIGPNIYSITPDYTVDWINKTITLASALPSGDYVNIYIYEVGNGDQLEKSNSQTDPIRVNDVTGFNEIYLNCNYSATLTSGSGVIRPGTEPINVIVTETESIADTLLCDNVSNFTLNDQIIFEGDVFGNIVAGTHYYVKTVSTITKKITISDSLVLGVAGPTFQLISDTGSMDIIIQTGSGAPWSDPILYHNGTKLVLGHTNRITQTNSGTNTIVCNTTNGMSVNDSIVFSDTMFGNDVTPQTVYYIESIVDGNEFTISATLGGSQLVLTNAVGGAIGITNDYAFGITDNGISAKIIFASQYDDTVDYLTYTVFGETFPEQYGYTIPETQLFEGDGATDTFVLDNYVGGDNPLNAIVEINGLRVDTSTYTISFGPDEIVFGTAPAAGYIISVTSYNLTDRQYFNTQYGLNGETVSAITYVNNATTPVQITTSTAHGLSNTNIVRIDGVSGSVQLNNNTYYVDVISSTILGLYYDVTLLDPVISVSSYTGGGYVWLDESFIVDSDWEQDNVDRLWVTINGYRVPSSSLYLNANNNLSILAPIASGDSITITSMMPSATPNQLVYLQNVNKSNTPSVFRANTNTRTWLVEPITLNDYTIYVADVTRITDTVIQSTIAPSPSADGLYYVGLNADKNIISQVIVYNETTGNYIDPENYSVIIQDIAPVLAISNPIISVIGAGDSLVVTTIEGNLIYINGEQIKFTTVDLSANSLSGIQRGTNGTGVQPDIPIYSEVFGILSNNLQPATYYAQTWNSYVYNPTEGDPLQISNTDPAIFLNTDVS